ncbi:MAG TPA: alpha/beta fold hydrolase [Pseudonocardiaceae bacterium]|nr:alpha/beta fold hydrolase [Pseudonocardiaceae bacterium]
MTIPVSLTGTGPTTDQLYGRLCTPPGATALQVLLSGITYDHTYWDLPGSSADPTHYSYVAHANAAGFATLALDRIGIGRSSHPNGLLVTINTDAATTHQAIQAMRADGFRKVVLVGHSYGSWTTWYEASSYHDVDAVVLSGVSHGVNVTATLRLAPILLHPAMIDPELGSRYADPTYLTTPPGMRDEMFHNPERVDPTLVTYDETHKSTVTVGEIDDFPLILLHPLDIRVPVLVANGSADPLFCGLGGANCSSASALVRAEKPHLGSRVPEVDGFILPGAGHDLNYAPNAAQWFSAAQVWITQHTKS